MTVNFKYSLGEVVRIKELNWPATVISLWYGKRGIEYECRYVTHSEYKQVYFFEFELEPMTNHKGGDPLEKASKANEERQEVL